MRIGVKFTLHLALPLFGHRKASLKLFHVFISDLVTDFAMISVLF